MSHEFEMNLVGELSYFLGLQIRQLHDEIFITQAKYAKNLVKKFGLENTKHFDTPMSTTLKLSKDDRRKSVEQTLYQGMIGSLLYLTASRPDISFSVGFNDADWAENCDDKKSTSGNCFFLVNNLVSWFCKKQNSISLSTAEAEYIAAGSGCTQLLWMKQMLVDYGFNQGLKQRFRSAAIQPPIKPPNSKGGFIRRPGRRSRPPITNRGENQGDAKCISIGGLRANQAHSSACADVSEHYRETNYKTQIHTTRYNIKVLVCKVTCEENAHMNKYAK
ncbi:hypothetical protein Q3G72_016763 [Acer saccharum]|nr:hypothetical protein Q3G72_016763 [Acer saccharum]